MVTAGRILITQHFLEDAGCKNSAKSKIRTMTVTEHWTRITFRPGDFRESFIFNSASENRNGPYHGGNTDCVLTEHFGIVLTPSHLQNISST